MELSAVIYALIIGAGLGAYLGSSTEKKKLSRELKDVTKLLQVLRKDRELNLAELQKAKQELDALRKELESVKSEREALIKKYEEELSGKERQLQAQILENKRLSDLLEVLKLEKKKLETELRTLESAAKSRIPDELVRSLGELEKLVAQIKSYVFTGEAKNYRLLENEDHEQVFSRMFAEEDRIFLVSPFVTSDAVRKRRPEIRSFLDRGGSLFLVVGREWNSVKSGDDGLLELMREIDGSNSTVFADNVHHKLLVGQKTAVVTSYNFLSKNNRLRETGIEIDDETLASTLTSLEAENLKVSQLARKLSYCKFRVLKTEHSTSGKTFRVETDNQEFPRVYFSLNEEPLTGALYEAVVSTKLDGSYAAVIAFRKLSDSGICQGIQATCR